MGCLLQYPFFFTLSEMEDALLYRHGVRAHARVGCRVCIRPRRATAGISVEERLEAEGQLASQTSGASSPKRRKTSASRAAQTAHVVRDPEVQVGFGSVHLPLLFTSHY